MNGNHLLRSTLLVLVCLLTVLIFSRASVMAQDRTTEGSLFTVNQGKVARPCPLKHTEVKTEITGFLARVTVTQQFENPFPDKIEAVYIFPLPAGAAVDDMTIVVGNRTVRGTIMRREDARATYDAARSKGQVAALLDQERPNVFTQAVANILPGERIDVMISYVETLKYEAGSYEWSFPMVVAERYVPGERDTADKPTVLPDTDESNAASAAKDEPVPDANRITPAVMPKGMRAGHDISIDVTIDAGVPLIGFHSETHKIEALQPGVGRATVRLQDQAVIPNKDFVLKYDVGGTKIEDALLTYRKSTDGFFAFILQPPDRITVEDVTPKEMVFVLDTSGSMEGFPIEKAKETMMLALEGLYPRDTFNVITFAGETRVLFPEPVPATKENLDKAKRLLAKVSSAGGTEMMQAIRAALEPSDAQDHVRITCFMTDGLVGNDMEIIAEVQKHKNARVFAMGFSAAPNRFLLDKITEYGRGEVEYVTDTGDSKNVARRFHERIRNPLLTDVSIDWGGLPVADVFPQSIPDLFSAKPVVVFGRYAGSGKGVIRLKGMMSGREVIREIPVELPDQEPAHNVLATLWARQKIENLMGQDMSGAQTGNIREELKSTITKLGLSYRLMTQYTSFVAVDDQRPADGIEPRREDVPVESPANGGINATVTVTASSELVESSVSNSTINTSTLVNVPIQGRNLQGLMMLAPGTTVPSGGAGVSVNGQRPRTNSFVIDGVDSNSGITPGGLSPGASVAGGAPALTATGGSSSVVALDAAQEIKIQNSNFSAQYGRNTGGQVSVTTKAGTNNFHGSAFYYFGNQELDANDWFANSRALNRPRHSLANFGGTLGGPIQKDRWFFFSSYEGLRLRQPAVALTDVPSLTTRRNAPANVQALLNLFPLPAEGDRGDGFTEFGSAFSNRGRHDAVSFRIDGNITQSLAVKGFFNLTNSRATERGIGGFSLNTLSRSTNRTEAINGKVTYVISPIAVADFKVSYSHFKSGNSYLLDDFGGAVLPPDSGFSQPDLFSGNSSLSVDLNARNARLMSGAPVASIQRHLNATGSLAVIKGNHALAFGADYRRMFPLIGVRQREQSALFDGVAQAFTGQAARVSLFNHAGDQEPLFDSFAAYAEDEWRITSNLQLTFGLRWELAKAPESTGEGPLAVTEASSLQRLSFAPAGSRLWRNTFGNFAPRISISFQPGNNEAWIIRGGLGIRYDTTNREVGDVYVDSYPLLTGQSRFNVPLSFSTPSLPSSPSSGMPLSIFDPNLKLPYLIEWNASVQRLLGSRQAISAAYVANAGRRLLVTRTLLDQNSDFPFLRTTDNSGSSNYHALQVQFERRFSDSLGAIVSYTWARSLDNSSDDRAARALFRSSDNLERGPSDFDVRHVLTGAFSYQIPNPFGKGVREILFRDWELDSVFTAHSAGPVNVVYGIPTSFGFLFLRPDLIAGTPLYLADTSAAGGRRINPQAFEVPTDLRQGSLGRNRLRGFALWQVNAALRRQFKFTDEVKLILSAEAINVFNHPNFASVGGDEATLGTRFNSSLTVNPSFGQTFTNAARSSMGQIGSSFGGSYYPGAPRVLRLSARFEF